MRRLTRAMLDLFMMAAPILAGVAAVVAVLAIWPGAMTGLATLLLLAWVFHKVAQRQGREHHY